MSRIEMDPRVCGGQPVIKGTRIPVEILLDQLVEGESWESILKGYPELSQEDIRAALHFSQSRALDSHGRLRVAKKTH